MEGVIERSFNINLKVLRVLGMYSPEKPTTLYLMYGWIVLSSCLLPDPIFSFMYYVKNEDANMMEAGFTIFLLAVMIYFIPKLVPFIINNKKIRNCIHFIESGFDITLNEKQKKIVDECVRVCRRNSIFLLTCTTIDVSTWSCRPLIFSTNRELPMDIWLPFDPETNTVVFYCVYIIVAMGVIFSGIVTAAIDPLIAGLAYHAACQIMVLKDNLQNLSEYTNLDMENEHSNKTEIMYKKLRKCIEHHKAIILFVDELQDSFSQVVFSQFVGSGVVICFCCLQLSKLEITNINFFLMTFYVSTALVMLYFYCFYGTTLYEESNSLTTAAYMGQWYDYDLRSRRALAILMERSNKPMVVTAGKLLDLSLVTFTEILKKSYSLLAVLKNY